MTFIDGKWRQGLHLEPPAGWLNDPNGLSYFKNHYHVYFQYDPESAEGTVKKCWGHYQSQNLIDWKFTGTVLWPDIPEDRDGVYSGCAVVCDDVLHIFYTGNVKEPGDYDYITSGRGANVIHVSTKDGIHMSPKQVLLRNSDYPAFCSCHVRDPKVWFENDVWHMVLGARTLEDKGCVLFYTSPDLEHWIYERCVATGDFGYMWECPDCFKVDGHKYLSLSPQGVPHGDTDFQNVYASGYFKFDRNLDDGDGIRTFKEWDKGFDFYAPQTFEAPDGRRLLIGWMGIGDIPYSNPTTAFGYQHCLTLPREITCGDNGVLLQNPMRELCSLRQNPVTLMDGEKKSVSLPFDMTAKVNKRFSIVLGGFVELCWDEKIFTLKFLDDTISGGRKLRKARLDECSDIRVIADYSSLEIYLDGGRVVFGTRMYPEEEQISILANGLSAVVYPLNEMEVKYLGK